MIKQTTGSDSKRPDFLLGLPYLADGPLLATARDMNAPVLLSANSFSRWKSTDYGREWTGFRTDRLGLLAGMDAALDSAGFVSMSRYGRYPWSVVDYIDLAARFPWRFFAAMDFCCEPEIAHDRETVLDRITLTVRGYHLTQRLARERGIADRLLPVLQGRVPSDYARCLDRMPSAADAPVIGIGSVCRRSTGGPEGIIAVVDRIHDELGDSPAKVHLFGAKSEAAAALRDHPRVASFDSQAYGVVARRRALADGHSKTNAFLADVMRSWYERQRAGLDQRKPARPRQSVIRLEPERPTDAISRRIERAREEIRELIEAGEAPASFLTDRTVMEWAFDDEDEDELQAAA